MIVLFAKKLTSLAKHKELTVKKSTQTNFWHLLIIQQSKIDRVLIKIKTSQNSHKDTPKARIKKLEKEL